VITSFIYLINRILRMSLSYFSLEVIVVLEWGGGRCCFMFRNRFKFAVTTITWSCCI